jgi:hypothetical protein
MSAWGCSRRVRPVRLGRVVVGRPGIGVGAVDVATEVRVLLTGIARCRTAVPECERSDAGPRGRRPRSRPSADRYGRDLRVAEGRPKAREPVARRRDGVAVRPRHGAETSLELGGYPVRERGRKGQPSDGLTVVRLVVRRASRPFGSKAGSGLAAKVLRRPGVGEWRRRVTFHVKRRGWSVWPLALWLACLPVAVGGLTDRKENTQASIARGRRGNGTLPDTSPAGCCPIVRSGGSGACGG